MSSGIGAAAAKGCRAARPQLVAMLPLVGTWPGPAAADDVPAAMSMAQALEAAEQTPQLVTARARARLRRIDGTVPQALSGSLRLAKPGQVMLLGSCSLPRPLGLHCTPGPIFVHGAACPRGGTEDEVAPIVRANPLVSVRACDAADQRLHGLGQV